MQLPSGDFLGSLMPRFPTARMFLTPTRGILHLPRFTEENPTVKIGYFTFTNSLAQLMSNSSSKSRVNSQILGAFVNDPVISVNLPTGAAANFTFEHVITDGVSNATCVYWQVQENRWSTGRVHAGRDEPREDPLLVHSPHLICDLDGLLGQPAAVRGPGERRRAEWRSPWI
ncbi:Latrophilin-like protein LAT-2 [Aphelenchoides fujianensis]|nr:Latrophilin-like protein LAT-2 [Aphelenchoides fujianensis]